MKKNNLLNQNRYSKPDMPELKYYDENKFNPFLKDLANNFTAFGKVKQKVGFKKAQELGITNKKGESYYSKNNYSIYEDKRVFYKIYAKDYNSKVSMLGRSASKVLDYIIKNLDYGKMEINFSYKEALKHTGYSGKTSIYNGLKELLYYEFICYKYKEINTFYINVNYFYKGKDLGKYIEEYRKAYKIYDPDPDERKEMNSYLMSIEWLFGSLIVLFPNDDKSEVNKAAKFIGYNDSMKGYFYPECLDDSNADLLFYEYAEASKQGKSIDDTKFYKRDKKKKEEKAKKKKKPKNNTGTDVLNDSMQTEIHKETKDLEAALEEF